MIPINSAKISVLNNVMNDKNLSQTISDALKSPSGSLSRQKAASILRSTLKSSGADTAQALSPNSSFSGYSQVSTAPTLTPTTTPPAQPPKGSNKVVIFPAGSRYKTKTPPTISSGVSEIGMSDSTLPPLDTSTTTTPKAKIINSDRVSSLKSDNIKSISPDQYKNTLKETDRQSWDELLNQAANDGVGKETFWNSIITNEDNLRALEENYGLPKGTIPAGSYLSGQMNGIEKALREQFNLKAYEDRLNTLKNEDLTLETDLKTYIRGKDTYVKTLDTLRSGAIKELTQTSMPWARERLGNYIDFLDILKGRQQATYKEYVDDTIKRHDRAIEQAKDSYKNVKDMFDKAVSDKKTSIATLKGLITEQLDAVKNIEDEDYKKLKRKLELIKIAEEEALKLSEKNKERYNILTNERKEEGNTILKNQIRFYDEYNKKTDEEKKKILPVQSPTSLYKQMMYDFNIKYDIDKNNFMKNFPPERYLDKNDPENAEFFPKNEEKTSSSSIRNPFANTNKDIAQ